MSTTMTLPLFDKLPVPLGDPQAAQEPSVQDSLPDYTPRAARVSQPVEEREFEYKVERKKGVAIASLKVLAPSAYSKSIPIFCGAGPVKGSVNLYLTEPETITSVVLSVRGRFLPGHSDNMEEVTLFVISNTMWSKDSAEATTSPSFSQKKLSGTYSWPFSISIPEKVQFAEGSTSRSTPGTTEYILPQTYTERVLAASIKYEVILRIGRGKLKTDYEIPCTFGYIPLTRPPPFPALKTIAYQEGTPLLDPTVDVDGWASAKKVNISGTLFNSHPVAIECQLFLSAPLAYTRGSVIPLYMRMHSSSRQALDLLSTHKAVIVRLQRIITYSLPMKSLKNTKNYTGKDERDLVEAVWWPAPSQEQDASTSIVGMQTHTVCLNGEIHLKADLAPSTTFPAFTVEYHVCMCSFDTPGFKMAKAEQTLVKHPVDIVTSFAPGPRAVRHAPPGYDSERPVKMEFGLALSLGNAFVG
ncbi:hypothetical protein D9619_004152 [Psilocybe cf. subviscida]|uniref:Arrestin-like N-terminal domain-containing protein n=1 Tax=Psilocybe cf. subviscida TaxID=2480587 RepID=A0A8H5BSS1_9AGAR|nr:hypothetical protein D9619_004152 [Psilocybe cf. subviscida]